MNPAGLRGGKWVVRRGVNNPLDRFDDPEVLNTPDGIALNRAFSAQVGHEASLQRLQVGSVDMLQRSRQVLRADESIAKVTQRAFASLTGEKLDHPIRL